MLYAFDVIYELDCSVGEAVAAYLDAEIGPTGIALLRAMKAELDPAGILNPGKLLPS